MSIAAEQALGPRVLVVEDDDAQRQTLVDLIRDDGFDPVGCPNAAEALEFIAREDVPVAVVDLRLPDLTGNQVLKRLRSMIGPMRVIIHTAYGSYDTAREALNDGAFAYVEKLGDPAHLLGEVRRAMDEIVAEAIWELEGCLQSVTRFVPDFLIQLDRDGVITFLNRRLAGHRIEELVGGSLAARVRPADRPALERAVEAVFQTGMPRACTFEVDGAWGGASRYDCRMGPVVLHRRIIRAIAVARYTDSAD